MEELSMFWVFLGFYIWAGICLYLSKRAEINQSLSWEPGKQIAVALLCILLWPGYPLLFLAGD
jgi:hypothetical protein